MKRAKNYFLLLKKFKYRKGPALQKKIASGPKWWQKKSYLSAWPGEITYPKLKSLFRKLWNLHFKKNYIKRLKHPKRWANLLGSVQRRKVKLYMSAFRVVLCISLCHMWLYTVSNKPVLYWPLAYPYTCSWNYRRVALSAIILTIQCCNCRTCRSATRRRRRGGSATRRWSTMRLSRTWWTGKGLNKNFSSGIDTVPESLLINPQSSSSTSLYNCQQTLNATSWCRKSEKI